MSDQWGGLEISRSEHVNLIREIFFPADFRDSLKQPESPESELFFHRSVDICDIHIGGKSLPEVNGCALQ